jgi:hypothetical protein
MSATKYSDYLYRNAGDTVRVRIFQRGLGDSNDITWDADIFFKDGRESITMTVDGAATWDTKKEIKKDLEQTHGHLSSMGQKLSSVVEGW